MIDGDVVDLQKERVFRLIDSFVEKSGGIDQVKLAVKALRVLAEVKDDQVVSDYVVNVGKQPAGAKQLLAAALLGFSMASVLYRKKERVREKEESAKSP